MASGSHHRGSPPLWIVLTAALFCFTLPAHGENYVKKQPQYPAVIPDTGQDRCYDTQKVIPCPSPGEAFFGQDANYALNTPQYTAGRDNNVELITDHITGLTWQRSPDTETRTWDQAIEFTEGLTTSGFDDWRLPNKLELQTILAFGNTPGQLRPPPSQTEASESFGERICAWTITNLMFPSLEAKTICLPDKQGNLSSKYTKQYIYAVRGPAVSSGLFKDNRDQTVTDQKTGLMWQGTEILPRKWEHALAYCEELELGGFDDWRLPTLKELMSLVNEEHINPSIDTSFFPATRSAAYWTGTTFSGHPGFAWYVRFDNGLEYNGGYKGRRYFVRAVRGGDAAITTPPPAAMQPPGLTAEKHEVIPQKEPDAVHGIEATEPSREAVKTEKIPEAVRPAQPDESEMDILEPYPLDYRLYEE